MRQVARRLRDGRLELVEVPEPSPGPGEVSVRLETSVLSAGTERATLEVAERSLLGKARARPDQARQVLQRMRERGIRSTISLVRHRLDALGPLGYSAAGQVLEAGREARGLRSGELVAVAGGGFANHADLDVVPALLCAPVPGGVSPSDAAFATLGAIALHAFRRSEADVGSTVAVIGLGLIGQLAVRVALAAGCRVFGVDTDARAVELARRGGAEAASRSEVGGSSRRQSTADAVLICAATDSSDPVRLAAELARDRASVVVLGDVGMDVPRAPFYEKELDLRLSRSYGPGRYDPDHELHGLDYPAAYVRWTERRNMEAFLAMVADGAVRPSELVTHRFGIDDAEDAFKQLRADNGPVGILLEYRRKDPPATDSPQKTGSGPARARRFSRGAPRFALVGPGAFAESTIVPGLIAAGLEPAAVASASGLSAESARRNLGFEVTCDDLEEILSRGDIDLIVIATQHDSHAALAARALDAGISAYVEKPLALEFADLARVAESQRRGEAPLFVGFNRRHAPLAAALRKLDGPRLMSYRVNAGPLPASHWANDPRRGGGRLLGEGCHFVDFLCDQAGTDPVAVSARGFPSRPELPPIATDNFSIEITFADGGVGTVHYAADAPSGPGKERFESSAPGAFAEIDDFRSGSIWRGSRRERLGGRRQDKGFAAQYELIAAVLTGQAEAPSADGFVLSSLVTLLAGRALQTGASEPVLDGAAERDPEPGHEPSRKRSRGELGTVG